MKLSQTRWDTPGTSAQWIKALTWFSRCADMRVLAILLLVLAPGWAESDQSNVEAVLKQMEHALQTGDFGEFAGLWTPKKAAELEKMRPYVTARPETRYRAI